jgi:hypothetical protein
VLDGSVRCVGAVESAELESVVEALCVVACVVDSAEVGVLAGLVTVACSPLVVPAGLVVVPAVVLSSLSVTEEVLDRVAVEAELWWLL